VESSSVATTGRRPEFRDQPVFQQVVGLDVVEHLAAATILRGDYLGREADRGRPSARGDDLLETRERAVPRCRTFIYFMP
jgi:hypothetical protein